MGVADPDRLGVHGTSYGGYATVLLLDFESRILAWYDKYLKNDEKKAAANETKK